MAGFEPGWLSVLQLPHRAPARRDLPARRHRPLRDRAPAPTTTPPASPPCSRPPSGCDDRAPEQPRRLGRAHRRRGVPAGGHALVRPRQPQGARPRAHLSSTSTRSPTATSTTRPARAVISTRDGPAAGRALRGDRRRRSRQGGAAARPCAPRSAGDALPASRAGAGAAIDPGARRRRSRPRYHDPRRHPRPRRPGGADRATDFVARARQRSTATSAAPPRPEPEAASRP